jgi:hypothetical protein
MLSDEQIEELWVSINKGKFMYAGFNTFARAIEAAVLPEGWVAVPTHPDQNMIAAFIIEYNKPGSSEHNAYRAMLAAAPKAQSCDMGELCIGCSPRNADGSCPDAAQAEKQEPVKDEPVAFVHRNEAGQISMKASDGGSFDMSKFIGSSLYTHPQPDLTAEVERLRKTIMFLRSERPMARRLTTQEQRIAELESEVERLHQIARDAYEVWAGSDGIPEPITCVEAYLLQLLIAMRDEVKRGLK